MEILKGESDFFTSVEKALDEIDPRWRNYRGLLIVGSHTPADVEDKIDAIKQYRERKIPVLGICLGMQLMAIEYARNVLLIEGATSEEFSKTGTFIIKRLSELRVGIRPVAWKGKSTMESHWHHYALNNMFMADFQKAWALSMTDGIVEIMNERSARFHIGVQFHPEYQSSKGKPHPLLANFIDVCRTM